MGGLVDVCPRCGREGSISIGKRGERRYIYFEHRIGGKRVKHYVGPLESYAYVERLHNLSLKNLRDVNYFEVVKRALTRYVVYYLKKHEDEHEYLVKRSLALQLKTLAEFCVREAERLEREAAEAELEAARRATAAEAAVAQPAEVEEVERREKKRRRKVGV